MTKKEKELINEWFEDVYRRFRICEHLIKYPCSRLGSAMDNLYDTLADFPFDLE